MMLETNEIVFNEEELREIEKIKSKYPQTQAALMPVLWKAQEKFGWISEDVMQYIAELLQLPMAHVQGVASFYTMYHKKPAGRYHVQVCTNVSCLINGGDNLLNHACEKLGIPEGDVTSDGKFSLEEVECMGACGGAPMFAVNEDFYESSDICKFGNIIDSLQ
ncbi:MAG: dehydrogenase subunit [Ignavibacteria bacterium]|nr:dehydrogenase subunit [Ignavibacteria bacterium]